MLVHTDDDLLEHGGSSWRSELVDSPYASALPPPSGASPISCCGFLRDADEANPGGPVLRFSAPVTQTRPRPGMRRAGFHKVRRQVGGRRERHLLLGAPGPGVCVFLAESLRKCTVGCTRNTFYRAGYGHGLEASIGPSRPIGRTLQRLSWLAERGCRGFARIGAGGGAGRRHQLSAVRDVDHERDGELRAAGRQALVCRWPLHLDWPLHRRRCAGRPLEWIADRAVSHCRRGSLRGGSRRSRRILRGRSVQHGRWCRQREPGPREGRWQRGPGLESSRRGSGVRVGVVGLDAVCRW